MSTTTEQAALINSSAQVANKETNAATEGQDLWRQLLTDSTTTRDAIAQKHLSLLGTNNSGKSSLLAKLQGLDETERTKPVALDYNYIDVFADEVDDDPITRIHVWQAEGDPERLDLLKFGLNEENVDHAAVLICLDYSAPWTLHQQLTQWLGVVKQHIASLNLPEDRLELAKKRVALQFQQYAEQGEGKKKGPVRTDVPLQPLPEGVLTHNLGVPVVVVCTKSDAVEGLEKDYGYKDSHFEFIQQHLRRTCLQYGASLIYSSIRKEINVDLLLQYLQYLLFGMEFNHNPQLIQRDAIFVPAGWDSLNKIEIDFKNQKLTNNPDEEFEKIITVPLAHNPVESARDTSVLITCDEDQQFLQRNLEFIEKEDAGLKGSGGAKKPVGDLFDSLKKFGGILNQSTPQTGASEESPAPSEQPATAPQHARRESDASGKNEHAVLASFFNSLINKKKPDAKSAETRSNAEQELSKLTRPRGQSKTTQQ
eukprot:TRINITY_DN7857_c0_g1_i1.p1 TRINITY_DN7857_c0_g1~~TRINITY_DN7857_c0_g1_i1.p1  ORF type:complete len:482 (-),score=158.90 TRINITY_DN7857_c0_g1_i1:31-1476(-)